MKILFIDDEKKTNLGGAMLSFLNLMEEGDDFADSSEILCKDFSGYDKLVIGNFYSSAHNRDIVEKVLNFKGDIFKVEFDYNFCRHRSPAIKAMKKDVSLCPHSNSEPLKILYSFLLKKAQFIFMSIAQRKIYQELLGPLDYIDSCSMFSNKELAEFDILSNTPKNQKSAVIKYSDPNNSFFKGYENAVYFCKQLFLDYDEISDVSYSSFLKKLSNYSSLVFLPNNLDTCPRLTIEAKLMGLQVITNANSQHVTEDWWSWSSKSLLWLLKDKRETAKFLIHE